MNLFEHGLVPIFWPVNSLKQHTNKHLFSLQAFPYRLRFQKHSLGNKHPPEWAPWPWVQKSGSKSYYKKCWCNWLVCVRLRETHHCLLVHQWCWAQLPVSPRLNKALCGKMQFSAQIKTASPVWPETDWRLILEWTFIGMLFRQCAHCQ